MWIIIYLGICCTAVYTEPTEYQKIGLFKDEILGAISQLSENINRVSSKVDQLEKTFGNVPGQMNSMGTATGSASNIEVIKYNISSVDGRISKVLGMTRNLTTQMSNASARIEEVFENTYPCMVWFFNLGGQCIKQITDEGSWDTHLRKCLDIGGSRLLEITEERLPLLQRYLKRTERFIMWVGGRKNEEGSFKWPSGRNVSLSWGWNSGEPNNVGGNENCMIIAHEEGGTFNDVPCDQHFGHSLCEMLP